MNEIVGVIIDNKESTEYFYLNNLKIKKNITVIVETENGLKFGKVVTDIHPVDNNKIKVKMNKIIRIASKQDYNVHKKNLKDAQEALKKCKQLVEKYDLDMNIIEASYSHDRTQLLFKFLSDTRIDFRDLARDLANLYHTRIELRQIGVRDKSKLVGGIGCCGQELCCSRFLKEFNSVSIQNAKNQNLALNPSKINGLCGRLLCCLKYEDECYKECRKSLPNIGQTVDTKSGSGKVISIDILNKKYKVETENGVVEVESSK